MSVFRTDDRFSEKQSPKRPTRPQALDPDCRICEILTFPRLRVLWDRDNPRNDGIAKRGAIEGGCYRMTDLGEASSRVTTILDRSSISSIWGLMSLDHFGSS